MSEPVHITALTYGPHGVGRLDGKVVFVRGVVPGEDVRVVVREDRSSFAYADVTELLSTSADRRQPPCPYLPRCGGCPWQHIDYAAQLRAKEQNLRDHLARTAGLTDVALEPIIASPTELGYRSRLTLRTDGHNVGFYAGGTHELVPIEACLLAGDELNGAVGATVDLVRTLDARVRRIEIAQRHHSPGVVLIAEVEGGLPTADRRRIEDWLRQAPRLCGVHGVVLHGRNWRHAWGDEWTAVVPQPDLTLVVRAGSFTQVNPAGNQQLVRCVVQAADPGPQSRILDLYAGVGNLTFPLALRAGEVVAVEHNRLAAEDARRNAKGRGMRSVSVLNTSAQQAVESLNAERHGFDVVVLDPPRSGAAEITDGLLALAAPKLVYVSCNPATLARDLKRLAPRYRVVSVQPIDLFPQTYHVETVVQAILTC
ncbi:MAG: 23S rRNA (uracil(1939)-C(5))-methyltransferase RlmD [Deltaproteobacteria bacterium]|nr:23S rRNA (uracil(1939)-C(5))-methyltransferase RlmD [Deltaproteobacteria bacterium]